jgi:hypothetical protein
MTFIFRDKYEKRVECHVANIASKCVKVYIISELDGIFFFKQRVMLKKTSVKQTEEDGSVSHFSVEINVPYFLPESVLCE